MVLIKQHVSACLEAIIRFTNVGYRILIYMGELSKAMYITRSYQEHLLLVALGHRTA
jgi:hypothetical protein